jgi:hypothetical protein
MAGADNQHIEMIGHAASRAVCLALRLGAKRKGGNP